MSNTQRIPGLIELRLKNVDQLFNTMDPSPFHDRDLDHAAEEFIVSWAKEHEKDSDLRMKVVLEDKENAEIAHRVVGSIHRYFDSRAAATDRELKALFREGRITLLIGLGFLALTKIAVRLMPQEATWAVFIGEGLHICGWVALWKPIDIHLYCWWPLREQASLLRRLSQCPVEVVFEP